MNAPLSIRRSNSFLKTIYLLGAQDDYTSKKLRPSIDVVFTSKFLALRTCIGSCELVKLNTFKIDRFKHSFSLGAV